MGSAIECFDNAGAVVVPRERFAPVKTTNDLFLLRSDVYQVCTSLWPLRRLTAQACRLATVAMAFCQPKPTSCCALLCDRCTLAAAGDRGQHGGAHSAVSAQREAGRQVLQAG